MGVWETDGSITKEKAYIMHSFYIKVVISLLRNPLQMEIGGTTESFKSAEIESRDKPLSGTLPPTYGLGMSSRSFQSMEQT